MARRGAGLFIERVELNLLTSTRQRRCLPPWLLPTAAILALLPFSTYAQGPALKFWNLTGATVTQLYVAPAGTGKWSENLCLDDPDHAVDADERLSFHGIAAGTYDVRVVDSNKRSCLFHHVQIKAQGPYAFSVSEDQMKACSAP
jgi:hypothetical protein